MCRSGCRRRQTLLVVRPRQSSLVLPVCAKALLQTVKISALPRFLACPPPALRGSGLLRFRGLPRSPRSWTVHGRVLDQPLEGLEHRDRHRGASGSERGSRYRRCADVRCRPILIPTDSRSDSVESATASSVPAPRSCSEAGGRSRTQRLSIPSFSGFGLRFGPLLQASASGSAQGQPKPRSALAGTSRGLQGTSRVTSPHLSAVSGRFGEALGLASAFSVPAL